MTVNGNALVSNFVLSQKWDPGLLVRRRVELRLTLASFLDHLCFNGQELSEMRENTLSAQSQSEPGARTEACLRKPGVVPLEPQGKAHKGKVASLSACWSLHFSLKCLLY